MRTIIALACVIAMCHYANADETTKPQIVSASDLVRDKTIIYGLLQKPLGTVQEVTGQCVEPYNQANIPNSMRVTGSAGIAWGAGMDIEIRGLKLERGKAYHFKGYESAEFVGTAIKNNPDAPPLRYNPIFVITTVFDAVPTDKGVDVADIKITLAETQTPLPLSPPTDVRNEKFDDTDDYGPLSKIFAGNIAALKVISSDSTRFKSEAKIAQFLRQLLTVSKGSTWKFEVWSQGIQPMLVVTVEHVQGQPGKWYIGPKGDHGVLSAYQDGNGRWWFSSWDDLTDPESAK
jgi:hypothetical protein